MTLVIMAAGLGSRYGSFKQIEPVGKDGELIIDFSIRDALDAGFKNIVFIINSQIEADVKRALNKRKPKAASYQFVCQDDPKFLYGFKWPKGRKKPLGTAHALLTAKDLVNENFAVINADDYYGKEAFHLIYNYMNKQKSHDAKSHYCMVGYKLLNTLTSNGHVSRGICQLNQDGFLRQIVERTKITQIDDSIKYCENGLWHDIPYDSIASLNCFGFGVDLFAELEKQFPIFMNQSEDALLKAEFFLPTVVDNLMTQKLCDVKVLMTNAKWYGMTYKEDLPIIKDYFYSLN